MYVQVVDYLSGIDALVHGESISAFSDAKPNGDPRRYDKGGPDGIGNEDAQEEPPIWNMHDACQKRNRDDETGDQTPDCHRSGAPTLQPVLHSLQLVVTDVE